MFTPKPRYRFYGTPTNYLTAARHVLQSPLGGKDYRQPLEDRVAGMVGVDHAICVPQARFGLYLIFKQLCTPERPNVVMSPYTIHDVVNMVLCAGGVPVFADIQSETCNIDPAQIEKLVDQRTAAVMVTHLHGLACDMDRIMRICDAAKVPVVEDAAQAFGARVGGRLVGGIGQYGVFSFGRAKNINAFFGGMVTTKDAKVAAAIRAELATLPDEDPRKLAKRIAHCVVGDLMTFPPLFSPVTFKVFRYGAAKGVKSINKVVQTENDPVRKEKLPEPYRRRLTSMQARLVLEQLDDVDANTARRLELARIYHEGLSGLPGIDLAPWREDGSHIYLQFPLQIDDRWDYVRYMMTHGRDLAIQHMGSAADLDIFKEFSRDCPNARRTAERVVLLPTYPGYGADEARASVEVTREYLTRKGAPGQ